MFGLFNVWSQNLWKITNINQIISFQKVINNRSKKIAKHLTEGCGRRSLDHWQSVNKMEISFTIKANKIADNVLIRNINNHHQTINNTLQHSRSDVNPAVSSSKRQERETDMRQSLIKLFTHPPMSSAAFLSASATWLDTKCSLASCQLSWAGCWPGLVRCYLVRCNDQGHTHTTYSFRSDDCSTCPHACTSAKTNRQ